MNTSNQNLSVISHATEAYIHAWKNENFQFQRRRCSQTTLNQTIRAKGDTIYNQGWAITFGAGHASQEGTLCTDVCLKTASIRT